MSLFPFFKKKNRTGVDSTLNSSDILNEPADRDFPAGHGLEEEIVKPTLALPSHWNISKEQEYVLSFLSNDLPPLKKNQISLAGISITLNKDNKNWNVESFIRSSLNQAIKLKTVELLLLDDQDNVIANQEFDLSTIGEIQKNSNIPWIFEFHKKNINSVELPTDGWKLAFNIQSLLPHSMDLEESWKEKLSINDQKKLAELIEALPDLKPNEVNVTGFKSSFTNEDDLVVSLLIRNGSNKNIQFNKIPLEIRDRNNSLVASGVFEVNDITVKRNTTKPWTFIFPKKNILDKNADMSKWKVLITQNK